VIRTLAVDWWAVTFGTARIGAWTGCGPAQSAVPNVTAHPTTASVLITVLLYNGPLSDSDGVSGVSPGLAQFDVAL